MGIVLKSLVAAILEREAPSSKMGELMQNDPKEHAVPEITDLVHHIVPLMRGNKDLFSIFDMIAGAILCLMEARRLGFQERPGPLPCSYHENVLSYVEAIGRGEVIAHRLWLAGWNFNSALVRIAAAYHRTMKAIAKSKEGYRKELLKKLPNFLNHDSLDRVYDEVNGLKHDPTAGDSGRTVSFEEAILALEELVAFISISRSKQDTTLP